MNPFPIPTPFAIPTPDPLSTLDTTELWSVENWSRGISAFQTVFVLVNQNYILSAFIFVGCVSLAIYGLTRIVAGRPSNV